MAQSTIKFVGLKQLLLDLGFRETTRPGSHHLFRHDETDTEIVLPSYRANQQVLPRHLLTVRIMLDAKGLLVADDFDQWVTGKAAQQPATG